MPRSAPRKPAATRTGTARGKAVYLLRADLMPGLRRDLLLTAARAVLVARRGALSDQLAPSGVADPVSRRRPRNRI